MHHAIATTQPFSFAQTIAFVRRFPAIRDEYIVTDDSITAAVAIEGRAVPFTVRDGLIVETSSTRAAKLAADFVGASDDLGELYSIAEGDAPFRAVVRELHGLHHVRFLTLGEIAVYSVLMQRAPIAVAAAYKRRFLARFGLPVDVGGETLRAMPELDALAELDGETIGEAIGHRAKGERVADVVHGVAELGEEFLRTASYERARDALIEIPGVGPFSAAAILLRGLGRMDGLPLHANFEEAGRAIYGERFDFDAVLKRYGRQIGYWAFYAMTGAERAVTMAGARAGASRPRARSRSMASTRVARAGS